MAPLPEHVRRAEEARLAEMLDGRLPRYAVTARDAGLAAVAWPHNNHTACLARLDGGPTLSFDLNGILREPAEVLRAFDGARAGDWPQFSRECFLRPLGMERVWLGHEPADLAWRWRDPDRSGILLELAGGFDAPAAMLLDDTGLGDAGLDSRRGMPFSSDGEEAQGIHAFVRTHPWLADEFLRRPGTMRAALAEPDPDAAAVRILAGYGVTERDARRVAGRLRWSRPTGGATMREASARLLASLPEDLFPPPLTEATRLDRDAVLPYLVMWCLLPLADALARVSGRDVRAVLGRVGCWWAYHEKLARRIGSKVGREHATQVAFGLSYRLGDMAHSLAAEVLLPAAMAVGASPRRSGVATLNAIAFADAGTDPYLVGALRLLLGDGTLPSLTETSGRWHARANAMAREVASLRAMEMPAGPRLFDDVDLGEGRYLTCLATVRELLDEGAPGPDSQGVPGLDHCVGTYGDRVADGETAIVSLRRRLPGGGFERISTAQVDFRWHEPRLGQHMGLRNAPVTESLDELVRKALPPLGERAAAALRAHVRPERGDDDVSGWIHRTGSWERVRDMWSFALTRPQRSMGPAEILREAGIDVTSHRPRSGGSRS